MAVSKEFMDAVNSNDALSVRLLLKNSLILDSTGKSFDEMLSVAKNQMEDLIVEHDGESFKGREDWNKDYYNEQTVKIVNNFSEERIGLLKEMAKVLFASNDDQLSKNVSKNEQLDAQMSAGDLNEGAGDAKTLNKIIGAGVAVAGLGLLIGGLIVEDATVAIPIIGGATIGVGVYLFFRK
ncbi:hypothetical protein SAMN02910400_01061 [Lachnospiraceae bacterium C10]|nr:hypothetical protein SAMN02910400_01061 [Lachnospiraceae bacterium C10]